jgi:diketogulonate reductase-like aldo/keto reductase
MLRWGLRCGRLVIPKSIKPSRIADNIDVIDLDLTQGRLLPSLDSTPDILVDVNRTP